MQKKLTVKDILDAKGKNKLAEVYTHYSYEAEACELAGIDMIISSENNDVLSIEMQLLILFLLLVYNMEYI